jgi:multicomponent Na+:H+ antiporter subunit E
MKKLSLINLFLSFVALMAFWLIMSGIYQPMQIAQGVVSVVIVIAINHKLKQHKFFEDEMDDLSQLRFQYTPIFLIWLIIEIVKAGLHVANVIINPNRSIETYILKFKVDLPSAHAKMILGNSITLTPGTLTIDITGDEYTVHALTPKSFEGITSDVMPRKVLKLFSSEERQVVKDIRIISKSDQIGEQ